MTGPHLPRLSLACLLTVLASVLSSWIPAADLPRPQRIPWTTSRIHGSPDPAKPYVARQIYEKLTFREVTEIVFDSTSKNWFILERAGRIFSIPHDGDAAEATLIADLKAIHPDLDYLYGFAFHPNFAENQQVFITYTTGAGKDDGTKLSRFILAPTENREPRTENLKDEQVILTWRSGGHNGANLQFGPDGFLYVSTGDSEVPSPPDPLNTGQDISDLLSSILRIDVDRQAPGLAYSIPKDNPFIAGSSFLKGSADTPVRNQADLGGGAATSIAADKSVRAPLEARPEVWAYGLRNPWKMSFDRATGRLWCGDVGWELWEMIHLIERGGNYGWSAMEASQPVRADAPKPPTPIRPPIVAHPHSEAASITGGYVYHGHKFHELEGAYIYGDWETGKIWALWYDGKQVTRHDEIADTPHKIIAFGQDEDGELIYANYGPQGTLHTLERNPEAGQSNSFPRKLSETGLFKDVANCLPADGVYKLDIKHQMWDEAAGESTWIALPDLGQIKTKVDKKRDKNGGVTFNYTPQWPKESVLARTVTFPTTLHGKVYDNARVETQILHFDGMAWNGYTYHWRDDQTDADLVPASGDYCKITRDKFGEPGVKTTIERRLHSRAECMRCHNSWCGGALAITPSQLDTWEYAGVVHMKAGPSGSQVIDGELTPKRRQLDDLVSLGIVDSQFAEGAHLVLTSYQKGVLILGVEPGEQLPPAVNQRARSYFHVNCSHCHRQNAGGAVTMMLNAELPEEEMRAINVTPQQGGLGLANAKLIDPGNPWNSVICVRLAKTGIGHMPVIGARSVDVSGLNLVEDWIAQMQDGAVTAADHLPKEWTEPLLREKLATVEGAMQVLRAVDDTLLKDPLRQAALDIAWISPQQTVRDLFDRFKPDDQREITLGLNPEVPKLLAMSGDAKRGSAVLSLQGKLGVCYACHLINGTGRDFGPDLSKVASRLKRDQILESLLHPSKVIAPGYAAVSIEMKDGAIQSGFIVNEGAHDITLKTVTGQSVTLLRPDIKTQSKVPSSLMPEGQLQSLTAQEAADVLTFLQSLK
jgi:putative heme-binding domain-containing protein